MGAWGAGLYEDDEAEDLREAINVLAKLPEKGDRLLEFLLEAYPPDDETVFWLVVADQFERNGIACPKAIKRALSSVEADLDDKRARGMDERNIVKRKKMLEELAQRLRSPRPVRPRPKATEPPPFVVDVGDVYVLPMIGEQSILSITSALYGDTPDGWGAFVVVGRGRVFGRIPWIAAVGANVFGKRKPSLQRVRDANIATHGMGGTSLGYYCLKAADLRRMRAEKIGELPVDPDRVSAFVAEPRVCEGVSPVRAVSWGK